MVTEYSVARGIPPSGREGVAVLDDGTACVIQSYDVGVRCGDRSWDRVVLVGSEGSGPGEFKRVSQISRTDEGLLAVIDGGMRRLTVFEGTKPVQTLRIPPGLRFLGIPTDSLILGSTFVTPDFDLSTPGGTVHWLRPQDPQSSDSLTLRHDSRIGAHAYFHGARLAGNRDLLFYAGDSILVQFDSAGRLINEMPVVHLGSGLLTEPDVAQYVDDMTTGLRTPPSPDEIAEYRATRMPAVVPGTGIVTGPFGTVWIARQEGRLEESVLEVRTADGSATTIKVGGRLLGFDILDSTLVVLRDPMLPTAERELSWHRIWVGSPAAGTEAR